MNAVEQSNNLYRLSVALQRNTIRARCAELTVLFDRCNIKELQVFFPKLIENIFGSQYNSISWGLRSISAVTHYSDFDTIQHFFSPLGPLFKLIYHLLQDPNLKYELHIMSTMHLSDFYVGLTYSVTENRPTSLLLNPFDYYILSFAYHLVDPKFISLTPSNNMKVNSLYYMLCCDYVLHFLPSSPDGIVLPATGTQFSKNSEVNHFPVIQRPIFQSNLFKVNAFTDPVKDFEVRHSNTIPKRDVWRSESVLHFFIDVWLATTTTFDVSVWLPYSDLPSAEHIRVIRVLVKQLHGFASCDKQDMCNMAELRQIARKLLQTKLYRFLRNLIHRWPLDGSFRLVLELWLSFIQPWRYRTDKPKINKTQPDGVQTDEMHKCEPDYMLFIAENLLPYIVIFQQLLPRFLRVDLSSQKNAYMLYRLTKVFDQENLVYYLRKIEQCVESRNHSPTHYLHHSNNGLPPLSPTTSWSTNNNSTGISQHSINNSSFLDSSISAHSTKVDFPTGEKTNVLDTRLQCERYIGVVRQRIYELEGVNFCYKPLFNGPVAPEVYELLRLIKQSERAALDTLAARQADLDHATGGFWGSLKSLFTFSDCLPDECSLDERKKVPVYLQCSYQYLTDMFEIYNFQYSTNNASMGALNVSGASISMNNRSANKSHFSDGSFRDAMTPDKIRQRTKNIVYEGDPDLLPIRTNENAFLVRTLYKLSEYISNAYWPEISNLYNRPNYVGKLARRFIQPPRTVFQYDKSRPGKSQRVSSRLPPRLSFRRLASHQILFMFAVSYLILTMIGYNRWYHLVAIFWVWCWYHAIVAFFDAPLPNGESGLHVSFNDSF